ncbi:tetratricopeptide repeat protein [Herminiimonas sp. CN]|uniref:YfgM family protein n=1 Tax=Herminiimonas sp. CN TaxID=1349818 RepID=UPI0004730D90|nr:tetratricopeptide repeat protein [Herminiimonas sp. CN]
MAYDHEEQEQLASIKAWWNQYGNLLTWLLIIVMAIYAGWSGWNYYQRKQSAQASLLYEELEKSIVAKDNVKTLRAATDLQTKFSKTSYAQMSALVAAKSAFDANDLKVATNQLSWAIDHGSDEEYKAIAKLRLSGLLLDAKSYDEALKLLETKFPAQFAGLVADRKGDIFVLQNKNDVARSSYALALEKIEKNSPIRQLIQMKLDALGSSPVKSVG